MIERSARSAEMHQVDMTDAEVDAFDDFYAAERLRLYRALALTLRDAQLAREAIDEAMTRAFEHWDRIAEYEQPAAWVYRVAFNWATSWRRKRRREVSGLAVERGREHELPDPEVSEAVARLPLRMRTVVVARYFLDWSTERTAEALSIPEGTVKSRLARALRRLAEELE